MECKSPDKCWCRECRRQYDARKYHENKGKKVILTKKRRVELQEWVRSFKANPCMDCGNVFHPEVMQFDHVIFEKRFNISDMAKGGYSKETIMEEILKCNLVCANCHALRTVNRRNNKQKPS